MCSSSSLCLLFRIAEQGRSQRKKFKRVGKIEASFHHLQVRKSHFLVLYPYTRNQIICHQQSHSVDNLIFLFGCQLFGWPTNIYGIQKKSIHVFEKSVRWVYVICGTFIALTCYVFPQCRMLKKDFINRGCLSLFLKSLHDKYSLQWLLNILYNVITIYTLECVIKYFVIIRL